jgi:hypothetical protein
MKWVPKFFELTGLSPAIFFKQLMPPFHNKMKYNREEFPGTEFKIIKAYTKVLKSKSVIYLAYLRYINLLQHCKNMRNLKNNKIQNIKKFKKQIKNTYVSKVKKIMPKITNISDNVSVSSNTTTEFLKIISQSGSSEQIETGWMNNLPDFSSMRDCLKQFCMDDVDDTIKLLEDLFIFARTIFKSETITDICFACITFVKLRLGDKPLLNSKVLTFIKEYFTEEQSGFEEYVHKARSTLSKWETFKKTKLYEKLTGLFLYIISFIFKVNGDVDIGIFHVDQMKKEFIKNNYHLDASFLYTLIDTVTFVLERGFQYFKTGHIDSLLHSSGGYEEWFNTCHILLTQYKKSNGLNIVEPYNISPQQWLNDSEDCIVKGYAILKHKDTLDKITIKLVRDMVERLDCIHAEYVNSELGSKFKIPALGVLLYGDSNIGKSYLVEVLFKISSIALNLPLGNEYKFDFTANDKYYTNLKTKKWYAVYDEIAALNPNKAQEDTSVTEPIRVINPAPYTPPQADLALKGVIPTNFKVVVGTTNVKHLNASTYFTVPSAVQRRFKYVITPTVKQKFLVDNKLCIPPGYITNGLDNFWHFKVEETIPTKYNPSRKYYGQCSYKLILETNDIEVFASWYGKALQEHTTKEKSMSEGVSKLRDLSMCNDCFKLTDNCSCELKCCQCDQPLTKCLCTFDTFEESKEENKTSNFKWIPKVSNNRYHQSGSGTEVLLNNDEFKLDSFDEFSLISNKTSIRILELDKIITRKRNFPVITWDRICPNCNNRTIGKNYLCKGCFRHDQCSFERCNWIGKTNLKIFNDNIFVYTCDRHKCYYNPDVSWPNSQFYYFKKYQWFEPIYQSGLGEAEFEMEKASTLEELDKIYRRNAKKFHPDKRGGSIQLFQLFKDKYDTIKSKFGDFSFRENWRNTMFEGNEIYFMQGIMGSPLRTSAWLIFCLVLSYYLTKFFFRQYCNRYGKPFGVAYVLFVIISHFTPNSPILCWLQYNFLNFIERFLSEDDFYRIFTKINTGRKLLQSASSKMMNFVKKPKNLAAICAILYAMKKIHMMFKNSEQSDLDVYAEEVVPLEKEISPNWYTEEVHTNPISISSMSLSYNNLSRHKLEEIINNNTVFIKISYHDIYYVDDTTGKNMKKTIQSLNHAFCLQGRIYAINKHAFIINNNYGSFNLLEKEGLIDIQVIDSNKQYNRNIKMKINPKSFYDTGNEVLLIELHALDNKKDLSSLLPSKGIGIKCDGFLGCKTPVGNKLVTNLTNIHYRDSPSDPNKWFYNYKSRVTVYGDCGSPVVCITPTSVIIVGLHNVLIPRLVKQSMGGALPLYREDLKNFLRTYDNRLYQEQNKVEMGEPNLVKGDTPIPLYPVTNSILQYRKEGHCLVYGSFTNFKRGSSSRVAKTHFYDNMTNLGYKCEYGPPVLKGWKPHAKNLDRILERDCSFDILTLRNSRDSFIKHCVDNLPEDAKNLVHVISEFDALNGVEKVSYVDAIKKNTSAGVPYNVSKIHLMERLPPRKGTPEPYKIKDDIKVRLKKLLDSYAEGKRYCPVFKQHLKDEIRSLAKIAEFNTRSFTGCPIEFTIAMRQFFTGFVRLVQNYRNIFCTSVGIDCTTSDWHYLYKDFSKYNNYAAGDFSKFDQCQGITILMTAFEFIYYIMFEWAHFPRDLTKYFWCFAMDTICCFVDYNGDLIMFLGYNPSGNPLTVIINGIVNVLLHLYVYAKRCDNNGESIYNFFKQVFLQTYGDDSIFSTNLLWFNQVTMRDELALLNINYTMADKSENFTPFIPMEDVTFLKRSFVYSEETQTILGPLDKNSLTKSLMMCVLSKTVSLKFQCKDILNSVLREFFFYGENEFNLWRKRFISWTEEFELCDDINYLPTYDYCKNNYFKNSVNRLHCPIERLTFLQQYDPENYSIISLTDSQLPIDSLEKGYDSEDDDPQGSQDESIPVDQKPSVMVEDIPSGIVNCIGEMRTQSKFIMINTVLTVKQETAKVGPLVIPDFSMNNFIENKQTLEFSDSVKTKPVDLPSLTDNTFTANLTQGSDLKDFLSRPVLINTTTWTENTTLTNYSIKPWSLYFNNPVISKKLENFSLINCNLKIKVIINASPFYYGYAMLCYRPQIAINPSNISTAGAPFTSQLLYSQQPRIDIFPQTNSGGEMLLPFFSDSDWKELRFASDFDSMGELALISPQALLNANSVPGGNCTIQIYAWAENVQLSAPTLAPILQSGMSEFVEEDGAVSKMASNVASVASSLSDVPILGPYATATSGVAKKLGAMAKIFGFSDPPLIEDPKPMKNLPYPGLAVSDISIPFERLTLDPKNELSISSNTVGLDGKDELSLNYLCGKESLLTVVPWGGTDAVDTTLFQSYVTPSLYDYVTGPPDRIYATPMAHISQMFNWWRGDIIFQFKIICTKFHRGRLRISWDPQGANRTTADTIPGIYTKVIDITECTDVSIRVPYAQAYAWAKCRNYSSTEYWRIGEFPSDLKSYHDNGLISVQVMTVQTSPVADAPISIAVFVKGSDNLEMSDPRTTNSTWSYYVPQSGYGEEVQMIDQDETEQVEFSSTSPSPMMNSINMGEKIISLRQLLRRTTLQRIASVPIASAGNSKIVYSASYMSRYPLYYGYDLDGINTAATGTSTNFNFNFITPYQIVAPCFIAQRGGMNWTINVISNRSIGMVRAERRFFGKTRTLYNYSTTIPDTANLSAVARIPMTFTSGGAGGQALTHQNIQSGLQVNVPHYSNKRFITTSPTYATLGYPYGGLNPELDNVAIELWLNPCDTARDITSQEAATTIYFNSSIGIDYNLFFFINVPTIYIQSLPASG